MRLCIHLRRLTWFCCLLVLGGCAAQLPRTVAVSGPELVRAEQRLAAFLDQSCVSSIDSDVRLGWQAYGRRQTYAGTLLAAAPASVRFSVIDPLGRPLLILVVNGNSFKLADNREGKGYRGRLDSAFIRQYLPDAISADDLFSWFSGRIRVQGMQILSSRRATDGELYWYELEYGDRLIHLIGLDRSTLRRHLVLDERDTVLFDVQYSDYAATSRDCEWPGTIVVSGDELAADFRLDFSRLYGFSPLKQDLFQLELPPHFTVVDVE